MDNMDNKLLSPKAGDKRKNQDEGIRQGKEKQSKPSNIATPEIETQVAPSYAPSCAPSYLLTDAGTALIPNLQRPNNTSLGRAAFLDNDDDSDSEVEVNLIFPKKVIDKSISSACLEMDGLTLPDIDGDVFHALFHERQTGETEPSYRVVALKNLIDLFQACVLFEDCSTKPAFGDSWHWQTPAIVGSRLLVALGYHVKNYKDNNILHIITKKYKIARTKFILNQLREGKDPQDPKDPQEALLIQLIDRKIVFDYTKSLFITKLELPKGMHRVARRVQTVTNTLADAAGRNKLHTEFAAMVPVELRGDASKRPWHIRKWVTEQSQREADEEIAKFEELAAQSEPEPAVSEENTKPKKQDSASGGRFPKGYVFGSEDKFFQYGFLSGGLPDKERKRWEASQIAERKKTGDEREEDGGDEDEDKGKKKDPERKKAANQRRRARKRAAKERAEME